VFQSLSCVPVGQTWAPSKSSQMLACGEAGTQTLPAAQPPPIEAALQNWVVAVHVGGLSAGVPPGVQPDAPAVNGSTATPYV
jgi:hypothetical protein